MTPVRERVLKVVATDVANTIVSIAAAIETSHSAVGDATRRLVKDELLNVIEGSRPARFTITAKGKRAAKTIAELQQADGSKALAGAFGYRPISPGGLLR
jgi:predicted transcriptional regulator